MCGPLALSFNVRGTGSVQLQALIYNLARISGYTLLGFVFGAIGLSFSFAGLQQAASFTMGAVILIVVVLNWIGNAKRLHFSWYHTFTHAVQVRMSAAFGGKGWGSVVSLGFFNGLLPCGLVYLALAGAVASGNVMDGAAYMIFFGLGTLPLMYFFAAFGQYMGIKGRLHIRKYLPAFSVIIAVLLILRGLNLGIPYISPHFSENISIEHADAHQFCDPEAAN